MGTSPFARLRARHLLAMAVDAAMIVVVYYLVLNFRYAGSLTDWKAWTADFAIFAAMAVVVHLAVNWFTGVYTIVGRYMSLTQALRVGTGRDPLPWRPLRGRGGLAALRAEPATWSPVRWSSAEGIATII